MAMKNYIKEAKKFKRKGDYLRAGDLFEVAGEYKKALEMYLAAKNFHLAAQLMEKTGNVRKAAEFHEKAGNFHRAAEIFKNEGGYSRSARNYLLAKSYFNAALMFQKAQLPLEAAKMFERANNPGKAADMYLECKNFKVAAEKYSQYYEVVQNDHEQHDKVDKLRNIANSAAFCFENSHDYAKAASMYEKGNQLHKAAIMYTKAGDYDKAGKLYLEIKMFNEALETLKNTSNKILLEEASARKYLVDENLEKAAVHFEKAGIMEEAADLHARVGNYAKASKIYLGLEHYYKAGEMFLKVEDYPKAAECYRKAGDYRYAGELYLKCGDLEQAANLFTMGNHLIKGAELYKELGNYERAKEVLRRVVPEMADYHQAMALIGGIFYEEGKFQEMKDLLLPLTQNIGINKSNLSLFYNLAIAYDETGEIEKARVIYEGILRENYQYMDVVSRLEVLTKKEMEQGRGSRPAARYEELKEIGRSNTDVMFKARDTFLNRMVTIRIFGNHVEQHNFTEDERSAALLNHSNIITIFDSGFTGKNRFVVMEYVEGESLQDILDRNDKFTISEVIDVMEQVLDALIYAHQKDVIHKNLQPACIILMSERGLKVTDFSMPVFRSSFSEEENFMAPELTEDSPPTPLCDIYSLGLTFYTLLTNKFPRASTEKRNGVENGQIPPPSYWNRQVPKFLDTIVMKCIDSDPGKRFQSATELLNELQTTDLFPGAVIAGRYEITLEIGAGGMGRVFKAMDIELNEEVALKFLKPLLSSDQSFVERFKQEIRVSRKIVHPNVVKIYDFGEWHGLYYISMEYIHGRNLKEMARNGRRYKPEMIIRITIQILSALEIAHNMGIIHRDIKPQNIMLTSRGEVKLLDFGIARGGRPDSLTVTGQVIGTPEYISPEQANNKGLDHRSDLYSLGVVMYEMATGINPFKADSPFAVALKQVREIPPTPKSLNPAIPEELNNFIMKLLQKSPSQRFQTAKEGLMHLKQMGQ